MFDDFYGLKGRPFQLTPDPAFYFESLTHRKARSYLSYGLAQGEGFVVILEDAHHNLSWREFEKQPFNMVLKSESISLVEQRDGRWQVESSFG